MCRTAATVRGTSDRWTAPRLMIEKVAAYLHKLESDPEARSEG